MTVVAKLPIQALLSDANGAEVEGAQPPHESKLNYIGVHEQELHATAADTPCNRLHGRVARSGVGGQEHIFQRTQL